MNLFTRQSIANNEFLDTVTIKSPEHIPIIFSIFEDNSDIFWIEDEINLIDDIDENVEIIPAVQVICKTVGGPNPGRDCVFPFKWNGKVHNGCPIDPNDKRSVHVFTESWILIIKYKGQNYISGDYLSKVRRKKNGRKLPADLKF